MMAGPGPVCADVGLGPFSLFNSESEGRQIKILNHSSRGQSSNQTKTLFKVWWYSQLLTCSFPYKILTNQSQAATACHLTSVGKKQG